jgi:hypothetical protein
MKRVFVVLFVAIASPAVAQSTDAPSAVEATGNPIALTEAQKQAVINAAVSAKSRQKTPKEFSPTVGATVPKEVYLHGFRPDEARKDPLLKRFTYAFLDREILLVGGPKSKIVAVVPLPEELVAGEQAHQGAAEASTRNTKGGASPTDSVPSHTSPETIK